MSAVASAWALDADAGTPTNKLVLLVLADRHNKDTGKCCPSIAMLAKDTHLSETTVKKAIRDLAKRGLLKRVRQRRTDGSDTTNQYVLIVEGTIAMLPGGSQPPGEGAGDAPLEPEVEPEDQDLAPAARARARNLVWDCLVSVIGFTPSSRSESQDFGKTVAEIRAVIPQDATEAQIRLAIFRRRQAFERLFPGATFTHRVLRSKWGELGHAAGQRSVASMYPELEDEEA